MSQVDFYILQTRTPLEKFVCQLTETVWHQGYSIFIQAAHLTQAKLLDENLWIFRQNSFIPHDLYPDIANSIAPVMIGYQADSYVAKQVLINLTDTVPSFFDEFVRIAEIVANDPDQREKGRNRYRFYRDQAYTLKTHEIY